MSMRLALLRSAAALLPPALLVMSLAAAPAAQAHGWYGQFASPCEFSHRAPDDPIVFPGQFGASHSHDFFGNVSTDAASTLESLQTATTVCDRSKDLAAYWVPTLYAGRSAIRPRGANIYYTTEGRSPDSIQAFPPGLRLIAGDARAKRDQNPRVASWSCSGIHFRASNPFPCPPGLDLTMHIRFPDCWDGVNIDSADHKSHLAYAESDRRGDRVCPGSHPVAVPAISLNVHYPAPLSQKMWLSSGRLYTAHADFFNAWDASALEKLVDRCLRADEYCGREE
jgi:hypothetical protein